MATVAAGALTPSLPSAPVVNKEPAEPTFRRGKPVTLLSLPGDVLAHVGKQLDTEDRRRLGCAHPALHQALADLFASEFELDTVVPDRGARLAPQQRHALQDAFLAWEERCRRHGSSFGARMGLATLGTPSTADGSSMGRLLPLPAQSLLLGLPSTIAQAQPPSIYYIFDAASGERIAIPKMDMYRRFQKMASSVDGRFLAALSDRTDLSVYSLSRTELTEIPLVDRGLIHHFFFRKKPVPKLITLGPAEGSKSLNYLIEWNVVASPQIMQKDLKTVRRYDYRDPILAMTSSVDDQATLIFHANGIIRRVSSDTKGTEPEDRSWNTGLAEIQDVQVQNTTGRAVFRNGSQGHLFFWQEGSAKVFPFACATPPLRGRQPGAAKSFKISSLGTRAVVLWNRGILDVFSTLDGVKHMHRISLLLQPIVSFTVSKDSHGIICNTRKQTYYVFPKNDEAHVWRLPRLDGGASVIGAFDKVVGTAEGKIVTLDL